MGFIPFLWTGIIDAIFYKLGTIPADRDRLYKRLTCVTSASVQLIIKRGEESGPADLFRDQEISNTWELFQGQYLLTQ